MTSFVQRAKSFLFENKTRGQTVIKNTVWLSIANVGGRLLKAIIIIYGARVLGAADYGVFSYAVTLAGFFTIFIDPGINFVLIREGAKLSKERLRSLFAQTLIFKLGCIALSAFVVVAVAPIFSTLPGAKALLPLVALIVIFDNMREFFSSFFRAEEKMQKEAAAMLATNLGIVVFGFILMTISPTPLYFTGAYAAGSGIGACIALWLGRDMFAGPSPKASMNHLFGIMKAAWPFAIAGGLGSLLTSTDILIISWMRAATDVGIYSGAIRIVNLLYLIPNIVLLSTMPLLSRLAKNESEKFRDVIEKILSYVFLISIPLSLGGAILGTEIMRLVFGPTYADGGISFSILALTIVFDYAGLIIINALFAYDRQKSFIVSTAIGAAINISLDLILIPRWGIAGSAVATLAAQIASNSYLWHSMQNVNAFSILPKIRKIIAAGICMAGTTMVLLLVTHTPAAINIIVSGIVYCTALYALKEPALMKIKTLVVTGLSRPQAGIGRSSG